MMKRKSFHRNKTKRMAEGLRIVILYVIFIAVIAIIRSRKHRNNW